MRPMQPNRYLFIDAYILEELRRENAACYSRERLRLLAKLKSHHIPLEVALLAVEDPDARVRAWFAKNGALACCRFDRHHSTLIRPAVRTPSD